MPNLPIILNVILSGISDVPSPVFNKPHTRFIELFGLERFLQRAAVLALQALF